MKKMNVLITKGVRDKLLYTRYTDAPGMRKALEVTNEVLRLAMVGGEWDTAKFFGGIDPWEYVEDLLCLQLSIKNAYRTSIIYRSFEDEEFITVAVHCWVSSEHFPRIAELRISFATGEMTFDRVIKLI